MSTYQQWNDAIIQYFTNGEKTGAAIYLDISEDRLEEIGRNYLSKSDSSPFNWSDDFKEVVRKECKRITNGQPEVSLYHFSRSNSDQAGAIQPTCVAFLALMALAAHNMADDELAAGHNYFRRLSEILRILPDSKQSNRPAGMSAKIEEPYWKEWNTWLSKKGFAPTARPGDGSQYSVGYPLSQVLLRMADRERLFGWFKERDYPTGLDHARLGGRVRRDARSLRGKHLRELLADGSIQRQEAVNLALFEVYSEWLEAGRPNKPSPFRINGTTRIVSPKLIAGLYRKVPNVFSNTVNYYLYPPQPRRMLINSIPTVTYQGEKIELEEERSGWYWPLWDWLLSAKELDSGVTYPLEGVVGLHELVLPSRDFWLLVPDPDCPTTGEYATWQHYAELGTTFILLCKEELQSQLEQLQKDELLIWQGSPRSINNLPGWFEYIGVQITALNWGPATIENKDLFEALRPKSNLGLALTGGLRLSERDSWLEGYGPQLTILASADKAILEIHPLSVRPKPIPSQPAKLRSLTELGGAFHFSNLSDDKSYKIEDLLLEQDTDKPIQINWPAAGEYRIEVSSGADFIEKTVTIRAWQDLELHSAEDSTVTGFEIGTVRLFGPLVEKASDV